jgi:hypothetical protein
MLPHPPSLSRHRLPYHEHFTVVILPLRKGELTWG